MFRALKSVKCKIKLPKFKTIKREIVKEKKIIDNFTRYIINHEA
jgi:hypothetical protein